MGAEFRSHLQALHATRVGKTNGPGRKATAAKIKRDKKNDVRERAERKPRRSHQQIERENRDDKSLFPFLTAPAQETGEHGQQCDSRVSYPTSGGDILFLARLRSLHRISRQPRQPVMVWEPLPFLRDVFMVERLYGCADNSGQFGGTIRRIALGTASYRTLENRTGSPSRLTGISSSVWTSAQGVCQ